MSINKNLISRRFLADKDIDLLVVYITKEVVPLLKNCKVPNHCGLCSLYKFCKVINHTLICPWLGNNSSYGKI